MLMIRALLQATIVARILSYEFLHQFHSLKQNLSVALHYRENDLYFQTSVHQGQVRVFSLPGYIDCVIMTVNYIFFYETSLLLPLVQAQFNIGSNQRQSYTCKQRICAVRVFDEYVLSRTPKATEVASQQFHVALPTLRKLLAEANREEITAG